MITNYKDLPIGKYLQILAVTEAEPDEYRRNPAIVSILDGRSVEDLEAAPLVEFAALMRRAAFLTEPPKAQKARKKYECGPFSLVPVLDFKKITTAQYVDFQTFAGMEQADGVPPMVDILSCLMVPEGHKYCDGYDPAEVQAAIREHLSTEDVVSLYSFFIGRLLTLTRRLATFSTRLARLTPEGSVAREKAERLRKMTGREALRSVGDGLRMSMPFQRLSAILGMPSGK